jgi:hypothetical protein
MSASRTQRAARAKQAAGSTSAVAPLENDVRKQLSAAVKQRLGLREGEQVPAEIQGLVDSAAREVAGGAVESTLVQEVARLRPVTLSGDARSEQRRGASDPVLLQEAARLAAKKKALQVAGFSNDEAMRLLVAELTGVASRES